MKKNIRFRKRKIINKGLVTLLSIFVVMSSLIFGANIAKAFELSKGEVVNIYDKGSVIINIEDDEIREKIQDALDQISNEIQKEDLSEVEHCNVECINKDEFGLPIFNTPSLLADSDINNNVKNEDIITEDEIIRLLEDRQEELIRKAKEEERIRKKEEKKKAEEERIRIEEERLKREKRKKEQLNASRGSTNRTSAVNLGTFKATAYDLTPESQGGWGDKVASGKIRLSGHSRESARCIAVDPKVIPLGSIVKVTVPSMPEYNGEYIAYDVGGAIKGNKIDIFVGDFSGMTEEAYRFGRRDVQVEIVGKAWD